MCIMSARPNQQLLGFERMERRLHTRHRARTTVYVVMSGHKSRICKAKNLSANGVFVETENLGLRKGQQVQLAFAINLGLITKIHRRTAVSLLSIYDADEADCSHDANVRKSFRLAAQIPMIVALFDRIRKGKSI